MQNTHAFESWPENTVARYLTVGTATVDVTYTPSEDLRAACRGERCSWRGRAVTEVHYNDSAEAIDQKITDVLPPLQREAQRHAEACRAMPKPSA